MLICLTQWFVFSKTDHWFRHGKVNKFPLLICLTQWFQKFIADMGGVNNSDITKFIYQTRGMAGMQQKRVTNNLIKPFSLWLNNMSKRLAVSKRDKNNSFGVRWQNLDETKVPKSIIFGLKLKRMSIDMQYSFFHVLM